MNSNPSPRSALARTKHFFCYPLCLSLFGLCGCYTAKITEPPRTAIEQLVLSHASDEAMMDVDLSWAKGHKVYIDEKYFDSVDKGYAISLIRQHFSDAGALLMATNGQAEMIVEIRSGGLGMNTSETLIGIPALTVPVPLSGPMQTPEIAFYKSQRADSIGKFAMFAYLRETGAHVESLDATSGYGHFHLFKVFGVAWRRTDVPQLKKSVDKEKDQGPNWPKAQ